jgi:hypothetical protein
MASDTDFLNLLIIDSICSAHLLVKVGGSNNTQRPE